MVVTGKSWQMETQRAGVEEGSWKAQDKTCLSHRATLKCANVCMWAWQRGQRSVTRAEESICSHRSEFVLVALIEQQAVSQRQQEREETVKGQQDKPTHIVSPSLDLLVESVLVFIPKGWVPNQQDVEDDTCPGEETGSVGKSSLLAAGAHTAWD